VARNVTMEAWGFLSPGQYLIHNRDGKYCPAFQQIIDAAGATRVPLPAQSSNQHAYAERWVKSVKEECLSWMILYGEATLRHTLTRGIHVRRDSWVSVMYTEELNSGKSSVTLQRTDRHGSMGQKSADFQLSL